MKPRCLFPLCLLLPAVCGGDGSSAATTVRRRKKAQQTQNGKNDLRRQREVSDHSSDIKRFRAREVSLINQTVFYLAFIYNALDLLNPYVYPLLSITLPCIPFRIPYVCRKHKRDEKPQLRWLPRGTPRQQQSQAKVKFKVTAMSGGVHNRKTTRARAMLSGTSSAELRSPTPTDTSTSSP